MSSVNQIFTLTINEKAYQFKAKTFAKVSKRAGQLIKTGIYEDSIQREIPHEAAQAFVQACNLQQFKVTAINAFELLDLAVEYKIANLEKFVNNYIKTKGLQRPNSEDNTDYLGVFIEKMEKRELQIEDYMNVSKRIDKYITDDRMKTLYTIPLFRLILFTDYTGIDDIKLNAFTLQLLQERPEAAVPLLLRIDFSKLNYMQENEVFKTSEVHDLNVNFFHASSLSADRNHTDRAVNNIEKDVEKKLNELDIDMCNHRRDLTDDFEEYFQEQYEELKNLADEQKRKIDELRQYREYTKTKNRQIDDAYEKNKKQTSDATDKTNQGIQYRKEQNEILADIVQKEITKQVGEVRAKINKLLDDTAEDDKNKRDAAHTKYQNSYDSLNRNIDRMDKNCKTLKVAVKQTEEDVNMIKATLAAKMMKDLMRFDNFIRRNEKRFKIFDEHDIWGLTSEDVKKAETDLSGIEKRIDKLCPIRHKVGAKANK